MMRYYDENDGIINENDNNDNYDDNDYGDDNDAYYSYI